MNEMDPSYEVAAPSMSSLEAMTRGEIDAQISTAKKYPRDFQANLSKARRLALVEPEACHYSIPRAGKSIEGPSIRLAEILASTWGNLRVASRVMDIGTRDITVCAIAHDLESNVAVSSEVRRKITDKRGNRFSEDMVTVTANAASSIAFRNVVFKIVPKAIWAPIYNAALEAMGSGKIPMVERRTKAIAWFAARGVKEEMILRKLNRANIGEIDGEDIKVLLGISNAIKEETATVEEIFGEPGPEVRNSRPLNLKKDEEPREPGEDREESFEKAG